MSTVALLAADSLAGSAGAAAALRLARSGPVALVVLRRPEALQVQVPSPPPTPRAARLASALRARGHPAAAGWRLVRCSVDSPEEALELVATLKEMEIPTVVASTAVRCRAVEAILGSCDRVLLAADDEVGRSVARFAAAAGPVPVAAVAVSLESIGAAVALAHAGIASPPQWVEPLDRALGAAEGGVDGEAGDGGGRAAGTRGGERGQAAPLQLALVVAALGLALSVLGVAQASLALERRQATADVAALAGADALRLGARPAEASSKATATALANGDHARASVPDSGSPMPVRVAVRVDEPLRVGLGPVAIPIPVERRAEAIVSSPFGLEAEPAPGDYPGPFAWRQGKPMRPDVAEAFDRLAEAARRSGHSLSVTSAWRSNAEQARLFAAHPDPRWVAPPGRSLHRLGTELDLGPGSAWAWLAANAARFGFAKRYSWEPWHFGYVRSPGSTSVGWGRARVAARGGGGSVVGRSGGALPGWVPARYAGVIRRAAIAHGVSAAVLAAQIRAESDFSPTEVSSAGAMGISQLMPDEARRFGVDPFDPAQAIDAQARLMRELLGRFASVPLALAAYNAGPNAVARCGCIPPYPETRAYVARIIGWLDGRLGGSLPPVTLVA